MVRKQILSNEAVNSKGFKVMNRSIEWERYLKNPVLLWNEKTGEHYNNPSVGRVENIRLEAGKWIGDLKFDSTELGQRAQLKWDEGSINAVSICGPAQIMERNGTRYSKSFEVWEISLVYIPSNPDAVAIRDNKKQGLCAVEYVPKYEEMIIGLSAEDNSLIDKYENEMNDENLKIEGLSESDQTWFEGLAAKSKVGLDAFKDFMSKVVGIEKKEELSADEKEFIEKLAASGDAALLDNFLRLIHKSRKDVGLSAMDGKEELDGAACLDGEKKEELASKDVADGKKEELAAEKPAIAENNHEPEAKKEELAAEKPKEAEALSVSNDARLFDTTTKIKTQSMKTKPFAEFANDPGNAHKFAAVQALSARSENGEQGIEKIATAKLSDEQKNSIFELAATMANDPEVMKATKNITYSVNDGRHVPVNETIQALASGYLANTYLENPDLARIAVTADLVRQLFPNDDWTTGIRRVSVRDRQGIIWVESAINPEVYYGDRAPVNAKNYMYDDNPRALSRKIFATQPTVWQPINTDVLSYNDRALGLSETNRILSFMLHQYWLQIIAESVPAANRIATTGTATASAGRFPINPAAAGNVNYMTVNDFWRLNELFINQNYTVDSSDARLLLTGFYLTGLQQDEAIQSILTAQVRRRRPVGLEYGPFDAITRSLIAGYDTSSSSVVDAEKYFDKPVEPVTGAIIDDHVKPVLNATTYDIGLGFVPSEIMIGLGNTHIHTVSDPNDYGWKISICTAAGAAARRSNGTGLVMVTPGA